MTKLVVNHEFTTVKQPLKRIGCVFDWFEVRVLATPNISELEKLGYSQLLDKGCATHENYFETPAYSISWNIRKHNVAKGWSHIRLKNEVFYTDCGCKNLVDYIKKIVKQLFNKVDLVNEIYVVRLDYAFDFLADSEYNILLQQAFKNKCLTDKIEKYTNFVGKVGKINYTNFSAGCRSGREFYRLYYKTIENTDYRTRQPKKQYIANWHLNLFGFQPNLVNESVLEFPEVVRFEIELKPQKLILTDKIYENFVGYIDKFFEGKDAVLFLGENYQIGDYIFTAKDAKQLEKLFKKLVDYYKYDSFINELQSITGILNSLLSEFYVSC